MKIDELVDGAAFLVAKIATMVPLVESLLRNDLQEEMYQYWYEKIGSAAPLPFCYEFGVWECRSSPTEHCVYNSGRDPSHDNCMFCGEPEERK